MLAKCVVVLTLAVVALANSEYGGCRCAREAASAVGSHSTCPRACFNDYVPVCGFNPCKDEPFRTFDSKCRQESTICDGPGNYYYYIYNNTCESRR